MASRSFTEFRFSLERKVVDLFARVTIGGTGAPTLVAADSKGIKSIVRNDTGLYTITLGNAAGVDKYKRVLNVQAVVLLASGLPASPAMNLVADSVSSDGTLQIQFSDLDTPAATDPASGEELRLQITLSNSGA